MYEVNDIIFDLNSGQTLQVGRETFKALLVHSKNSRGEFELWIPKSLISYKYRDKNNTHVVRLSDWYTSQNFNKL